MVRPLRIEYPGAIYHIPSQGNARERIFLEDADRRIFLDVFGAVVEKIQLAVSRLLPDGQPLLRPNRNA
jgi:hypothetical protein